MWRFAQIGKNKWKERAEILILMLYVPCNICSYEYNGAGVANAGNGVRKLVNSYIPAKRNKEYSLPAILLLHIHFIDKTIFNFSLI